MIFAGSSALGESSEVAVVRAIQHDLAQVLPGIRVTGDLDDATVTGVNNALLGWDDAPARLRNGNMSRHFIVQNLGLVQHYVRLVVGGAQSVAAG